MFAALLFLSALPAILIGFSASYAQLLCLGLFLGLAGTTFSVGVGFTSKWFAAEKQGMALGVYGMGNIGQSVAVFGAPALALALGSRRPVFFIFASVSVLWGAVFYFFARDAATILRARRCDDRAAENFRRKLASAATFAARVGSVAFLFRHLRRLRPALALSADAFARTLQTDGDRCGRAHRRIRRSRNASATRRRRARRSFRRSENFDRGLRAHRRIRSVVERRFDARLHRRRARRSRRIGIRKRSGL